MLVDCDSYRSANGGYNVAMTRQHRTENILISFAPCSTTQSVWKKFSHIGLLYSLPSVGSGPDPVYRQSAHRWLFKSHQPGWPGGRLPLLSTRPAVTSVA